MDKEIVLNALASRDHQQALATINWLNNCQTKDDFNQAVKVALLPLMECGGAFYGRLAGEINTLQLLGSVNQSTCCQHDWEQLLNATLQKLAVENSVADNAIIPLPINATSIVDYTDLQSHHNCTVVTVFDDHHQPAYRFYFCRFSGQQQIFNQRDTELLRILRPTLLQTLRLILFREESLNSRQTLDFWSDCTDPIVVVRDDGAIIYQSRTFERIIEQDKHTFLLSALASGKTVECNKVGWYSFLSKLGKRLYEIRLILINADVNLCQCIYLLHLSRVTHKIGKIFNQLSRAGLTNRELEISILVYQGNSAREIAEEIKLSYHTVRNHIKSIYSKLGVSTRSELLSRIE
ncbi:helix-turn-helix transcriptional regulator [Nitrosomonas sp.]|uniref:response regulator transcription factor n=1 Tax=Nitrosomonas sp. TaxID=42353 RepID=UPI0025DAFFB3|nr:helix-turn-helix transcriptional regulator [Nitrosomonas sp.]